MHYDQSHYPRAATFLGVWAVILGVALMGGFIVTRPYPPIVQNCPSAASVAEEGETSTEDHQGPPEEGLVAGMGI